MNTNRKVGILMLMEVNKQSEELKLNTLVNLINGQIGVINYTPKENSLRVSTTTKSGRKTIDKLHITRIWNPIIICDDEIKENGQYYNIVTRSIETYHNIEYGVFDPKNLRFCKKILVLPNQFSQEFLQAIVDGKVKDGDKVEVEVEMEVIWKPSSSIYGHGSYKYSFKSCKDGTTIIHPYIESVEEAAFKWCTENLYVKPIKGQKNHALDIFIAGAEWQKNQK